ncbi:MAG: hypothetical protein ACYC3I_17940 [Gemmataceae bacterium]
MPRRFSDFLLMGAVLVFAFLASSFAVRNSDFWLHLASGRLLAEGHYQFGVDPFSFTTDNQYWANHAWLFDWPLYLLHARLGEPLDGTVLVILKALLISLLALVLLSVRRPGSRMSWPAACTLLAVLAMSPRLLLHSACLSYVLFGLTLWLLWRPLGRSASFGRQLRHYAPLLLLFVLWVNVDVWFLLGPLMALLLWLGEHLSSARSVREEQGHTPAWLWLAGLAVCLVNPHHVHAFTLPAELMPLPEALLGDVRFESMHASPWQRTLYYRPFAGVNLSSVAYLVLLTLGVLSFLLNARNLAGWRLLVWLTFAGLSAWLVRTIPFFAVVAAPITALNLQDAFPTGQETAKRSRRLLLGGLHLSLFVSALVLIALAWPGWLQGFRDTGRHVAWAVQPDGSLRRVAERLHLWHRQGKLGNGRGFLSYPSLVHYCAWYCPEEKGFLDQRLQLFRDVAGPYEEICQALNPALAAGGRYPSQGWRKTLHDWGITHLVLYDPAPQRLEPAIQQLAEDNGDWTLLDIDGQALIVGWRDGDHLLPRDVPSFNADRLAFTEPSDKEGEQTLPKAPAGGPGREPRAVDFWSHFGKPAAPSPWQTEAAGTLLRLFNARDPSESRKRGQQCFVWAAALPALPALSSGSLDGLLRLAIQIELAPPAPQDLPQQPLLQLQPPALPLLTVRVVRGALAENPDDANASLYLGRAYLDLVTRTLERDVLGWLPPLAELRHVQIAAAMENALRRDPNSPNSLVAHHDLASLYESLRFLDAALDHRRAALALDRRAGPGGGDAAAFTQRLQQVERAVEELERRVADAKYEFALQTRTLGSEPFRKAEIALSLGLARLALEDVLIPAPPALLGGEGVRMQVRLQLMLGRTEPVRAQLQTENWKANKANLGTITLGTPGNSAAPVYRLPAYEWLLLCQSAADGDYDQAEEALKKQLSLPSRQALAKAANQLQSNMLEAILQEMYWSALPPGSLGFVRGLLNSARLHWTNQLQYFLEESRKQAMLRVLAGLLQLERGQPDAARESFRQAKRLGRYAPDEPSLFAALSLAESYLRLLAVPRS